MSQPSVAVVLLNYNGVHHLRQFLPSVLAANSANAMIIVADNGSTDDSLLFLRNNYPAVQLVTLQNNYGFAGGYNEALKQVHADYYVLLNTDVEVSAGWIEPVIAYMQANAQVAACQPKVLYYKHKQQFEYAGAAGGWIDTLGYPFSRGRVFDTLENDQQQYDEVSEIFWATGAAMFVRSVVFHEMGGFDESFFAHQEEIDLCWRMQRAGYKIAAVPSSVVYHLGGGTLPKSPRKIYLNFRNNLLMLLKNMSWGEKIWKLPVRILLDWLFAIKTLMAGSFGEFTAVFKAHKDVVFHKQTPQLQLPKPPLRQLKGVYHGSIVVQYFIKGKKLFSQIVSNKSLIK